MQAVIVIEEHDVAAAGGLERAAGRARDARLAAVLEHGGAEIAPGSRQVELTDVYLVECAA